ncbi:nucleoside triphosphate hydrolase [Aquamicrobium sp. LC103]|uniref:nucleoside triphosphate hydrolase n=1 Tax=Aquamicrobium sp. LC103 TaxID=1120658 RepID=UPI00063E7C6D|nr:nucleoside triphosphate hydrolase [Aquamicrobium sp. LC103]TKT82418.1 nucleoside triphosphate hydrolase [Aquamicrobium sp. LC103]
MSEIAHLAATLFRMASGRDRVVVAIAGPPGAGKSTFAEALLALLPENSAAIVPMDGFHYDNAVLETRGLRARKGAPETFDFEGFRALLERLRKGGGEVAVPVFDRGSDLARAGGSIVGADTKYILVEGNYLLLDESPWYGLAPLFDYSVYLDVPRPELEKRLIQRWLDHDHTPEAARERAMSNDIPNAERVIARRRSVDIVIRPPG